MQTRRPRTTTDLERALYRIVVLLLLVLISYHIGLSAGRDMVIPRDSTPTHDVSDASPDRFIVSYRDTLRSGLVIEVVKDRIWHNAVITVTYFGNELAKATIDK